MSAENDRLRPLRPAAGLLVACLLGAGGCDGDTALAGNAVVDDAADTDPADAGIDADQPFSFFVVSDTQGNADVLREMVGSMVAMDPSAVACVNVGDLTQGGVVEEWEDHHRAIAMGSPVHADEANPFAADDGRFRTDVSEVGDHVWYMAVVGNHDKLAGGWHHNWNAYLSGQSGLGHNDASSGVYFSVLMGNTLILLMDSPTPTRAQTLWLERTLQSDIAAGAVFKLAFFHYPVYPCNYKAPFHEGLEWVELFERYGVDAVFHGHAHTYERTCPMIGGKCAEGGVVYITTSGAPPNTRLVLADRKAKVIWGDRVDEYSCSEILDRYRSYWNHWSGVEVDGCRLTFSAYPYSDPPGKGAPWDTTIIDKCP